MSEFIKFNDTEELVETSSLFITNAIVNEETVTRVTFQSDVPINLSGFDVVTEDGENILNSSGKEVKYLYRDCSDKGFFILTNNKKDVYVEPITDPDPEPTPLPEITPPSLDDVRAGKIQSLKEICNNTILLGVDVKINGVSEHFSYTSNDQSNIDDLYTTVISTGLDVFYHCDNGSCKKYTPAQVVSIWAMEKANKNYHTTYFNQAKQYLLSLTSDDDMDTISNFVYGLTLPEIYDDIIIEVMDQCTVTAVAIIMKDLSLTEDEAKELLYNAKVSHGSK